MGWRAYLERLGWRCSRRSVAWRYAACTRTRLVRLERREPALSGYDALQRWSSQSQSPAAPAGLQQLAYARTQPPGDSQYGGLTPWSSASQGYVASAGSWYTGGNAQGTNNGWDSQFARDFIAQQDTAANKGTLATFFEQPNATGVVTYDHASSDGLEHYRFGDIYQDGQKKGNVYTQFDRPTANLMMADWVLTAAEKGKVYASSDPVQRLNQTIEDKRAYNTQFAANAASSQDFQKKVDSKTAEFEKSNVDEAAIVGSAALGTAAVGAGAGAALTAWAGPGALVGGVVGGIAGGLAGGVSAWLNRDTLTQQAARAYEVTSLSTAQNGLDAGVATGISQWSGFAQSLVSPVQNTVQGLTDITMGRAGDGVSEFYRTDRTGQQAIPTWLKVAGFASMATDWAIQFSNPIGMGLYTAQMAGQIGGEVGELGLSGSQFDYSSGRFKNVFTDDSGHFDLWRAAAGIGAVGIDAVQLGMARGLAGKVDSALTATGAASVYGTGRFGLARLSEKLPNIALRGERTSFGGFTTAQREALAAGGRVETEGAYSYVLHGEAAGPDLAGTVVGPRRATMAWLAPSEQLSALSARVEAIRASALRAGAPSTDDLYRAALRLAHGDRKVTTILTNAFGEAYEEGLQQSLQSLQFGYTPSAQDLWNAAAGGFAGGFGMGVGTIGTHMVSAGQRQYSAAAAAHLLRTGQLLTPAAYKAMPQTQQKSLSALGGLQTSTLKSAHQVYVDEQATEVNAGVAGANRLRDAISTSLSAAMAGSMPATDGSFVLTQVENAGRVDDQGSLLPGSMPSDAIGASGIQTRANMENHLKGIVVQQDQLSRDLAAFAVAQQQAPADAEMTAKVEQAKLDVARTELALEWGRRLLEQVSDSVSRMYDPAASPAAVAAEVENLNLMLRDVFHMRINSLGGEVLTDDAKRAMSEAVSMVFTRYPQDQGGSFQVLVPQVSTKLTLDGLGGNDQVQISHAILPSLSADFDGDRGSARNQLILDDNDFVRARSGEHFLGAGTTVNVPAPAYEKYHVEMLAAAFETPNTALDNLATGTLVDIGTAIRNRYRSQIADRVLDAVLDDFNAKVHANDENARAALLDGLAKQAGATMTALSRQGLSNEWLWIDQVVRANFDEFQESWARAPPGHRRAAVDDEPDAGGA